MKLDKITKVMKWVGIFALIIGLSVLLGYCSLAMTVVSDDAELIQVLFQDDIILKMNIWPILVCMLLLHFITSRVWVSFLGTGILTFVIAEVNRFKVTFRDDPFIFEDLLLINEAKDMVGQYELFLDEISLKSIFFIVIATIGSFFLIRKQLMHKVVRWVGALVMAIVLVTTINQYYFEDTTLYKQTWHEEFGTEWKESNQYTSRGVIYSFIRSIPDAFITPPDGYNEKEMEALLENYQDTDIPEDQKVHVISIMLEAFNDFSQFEGIEFVEDPYKNFHELQKNAYYGNLFTNIFAANTITTERAFLTGYDDIRFRDKATESFVRYFKSQGYYAEFMHPGYGWFYDRQSINYNLGFDEFYHHENTYGEVPDEELEGTKYYGLMGDHDFFRYIIDGYEKAVEKDEWYFNFSVTYQNHGPYNPVQESDKVYLERKEEYTEAEYHIMNNYLRGIAGTDAALKMLWDYVDAQEEPIVLILFGDHNPWGGDGNSVYSMLGIDLNLGTIEGAKNYYQTPYVIYANDAAKQRVDKTFVAQGNTISPMFLMSEFFEYVGWEGSAYMSYLQDLNDDHEVINSVYAKVGDDFVPRSELTDAEWLKEFKTLEYYMKYDK